MTSFLRSLRMVAWSFLGIRKSSESQEETASLNPLHIVGAALVGVAVFVIGLVLLVNWVLGT
jgi:amino acid transporter